MNDLINIKVIQKDFNGEKKRFVNARELYQWLVVGRDFSNWIKDRIEKYEFVEDLDYFIAIAKFGDGLKPNKNGKIIDSKKEFSLRSLLSGGGCLDVAERVKKNSFK